MKKPRLGWVVAGLGWAGLAHALGLFALAVAQAPAVNPPAGPPRNKPAGAIGTGAAGTAAADDGPDSLDRVRLPEDRLAERKIREVRRLLEVKDWPQAVRLLQTLLDAKEDAFFRDEEKSRWVSIRVEANRLLGTLPREGLQFYELHYGGQARTLLEKAQAAGDPHQYADIALRYMYTEAGLDAAALLGAYHLDHGRYIVAALCYERLLDREAGPDKLTPAVLFKASLAFERAGDAKNRDRAWQALSAKLGQPGQPPLPPALRKLGPDQLREALALKDRDRPQRVGADWPLFLGTPDRDGAADGGAPFLEPRLTLDTVDPSLTDVKAQWIEKAVKRKLSLREPVLPGGQPIAVGDKVLYRTAGGTHCLNLATGKFEWSTIVPRGSLENLTKNKTQIDPNNQVKAWADSYFQGNTDSIFYDNSTLGTLSSDGRYFYVIEDLAIPPHPNLINTGPFNRWNQVQAPGPHLNPLLEHNRLVAYKLSGKDNAPGTGGDTAWGIGSAGDKPDDPFSGFFFLGPPLPLGDKLYVLAEVTGEIRLLCLDQYENVENGDVVPHAALAWSQTLCSFEERRLPLDPIRRTQAAHLAYADGILVCPTNGGVVFGVDLLTRSLVWAHAYQTPDAGEAAPPVNLGGGRFMRHNFTVPLQPATWSSAVPVIRDGHVVFTAPDSDSVRCLQLRNGKKVWELPRQVPEGDDAYLYLAGVHQGKVLLVGKKAVYAFHLQDGKPAWRKATGLPSGRGAVSGGTFYVPLQSAEVLALDIATGNDLGHSKAPRGEVPGNLLFHRGDVISQTPTTLVVYSQLAVKEQEVSSRLKTNPRDPRGLAERGELRLHRGDRAGAVADFRAALANQPDPESQVKARGKLYEALSDLLETDFAGHEKDLPELERLVDLPAAADEKEADKAAREQLERDRRARYLRLVARGREGQGRFQDALTAYLALGGLDRGRTLPLADDPGTHVVPTPWIQGRIAGLLRQAPPDRKAELEKVFQELWQKAQADGGAEALRRFADLFGPLCPQGRQAKLLLAARLSDAGQLDQAQLELVKLTQAPEAEPAVAAQATERLALLFLRLGDLESAGHYYQQLAQKFAKVPVRDGKTGMDLFLEAVTDKRLLPYLDRPGGPWLGLGERPLEFDVVNGRNQNTTFTLWLDLQGDGAPLTRRFRLGVEINSGQVLIQDLLNGKENRFSLASRAGPPQIQALNAHKFRPTAYLVGGVAVFTWVDRVYACDLFRGKELWNQDLLGEVNPIRTGAGEYQSIGLDANGQLEVAFTNNVKEKIGMLAVAGPDCVAFVVKDRGLMAVDPLLGPAKGTRWVKADVSTGTAVFGDSQCLYLVIPGGSDTIPPRAVALRTVDGTPVPIPDFGPLYPKRVRQAGRHLLLREDAKDGGVALRLYDVQTGQDAWKQTFAGPKPVVMDSLEPAWCGVIDGEGKARVLEVLSGKELFQLPAPPTALAAGPEVYLLRDDRWAYLAFQAPVDANPQPGQRRMLGSNFNPTLRAVPVNGPLIAWDLAQGKVAWQYDLPTQALVIDRFAELPVVICASLQIQYVRGAQPPAPNAPAPNQLGFNQFYAVVVLDKRSGAEVFKADQTSANLVRTPFHTLKVDNRVGKVELISQQTRLVLQPGGEQARR